MNEDPLAEEREWIASARQDPARFAPLYQRYHRPIFLFVLKRVGGDRDLASDLCSQAFLKAMLALPRYNDRGLPFKAWLYRIALNEVLMSQRRRKNKVYMDVERADVAALCHDMEFPADAARQADQDRRLTDALARLRPDQATLIELHWFDRLSYAEVGQVLGIGEDAAKMRTHRVLQRLRQYLVTGE